jgi:hypothetical protein
MGPKQRTIHAPILVALLVATACDTRGDDLDRELDLAAEDDDAEEEEADAMPDGPEALQSEVDPAEALSMRLEFNGPCSDAADRTGVGVLWIDRRGNVRGTIFDDAYPGRRMPLAGSVSKGGSFEAVERAPFGDCTWTGFVDLKDDVAYGAWDCGMGCDGDWSN